MVLLKKNSKKILCWSLIVIIIFFTIYYNKSSDVEKIDDSNNFINCDCSEFLNWYNYSAEQDINGPNVAMDDPRLINRILNKFLIPPVDQTLHPLSLNNPEVRDPSRGQTKVIKSILNNKKGGFFIEVGAHQGEEISNTLYFERYNNWTGLLIEANPINFSQLLKKNRRAWLSPTCVSINPYPEIREFEQRDFWGRITESKSNGTIQVQCIPLYSYLVALNITHVDFFSLDIEGDELKVLKTIPFQLINIQTLSVEHMFVKEGKIGISEYMTSQGYKFHSIVDNDNMLFVKV